MENYSIIRFIQRWLKIIQSCLQINGRPVFNMTHGEMAREIKSSGATLRLECERSKLKSGRKTEAVQKTHVTFHFPNAKSLVVLILTLSDWLGSLRDSFLWHKQTNPMDWPDLTVKRLTFKLNHETTKTLLDKKWLFYVNIKLEGQIQNET